MTIKSIKSFKTSLITTLYVKVKFYNKIRKGSGVWTKAEFIAAGCYTIAVLSHEDNTDESRQWINDLFESWTDSDRFGSFYNINQIDYPKS